MRPARSRSRFPRRCSIARLFRARCADSADTKSFGACDEIRSDACLQPAPPLR